MLLSMTGYGRGMSTYLEKTIVVEVRSLNSKFTDIRFKIPQKYKELEPVFRKTITEKTQRGKIDIAITTKSAKGDDEFGLNATLFKKYYIELTKLADELGSPKGDLTQAIIRLPNVVSAEGESIDKDEIKAVKTTLDLALNAFTKYRLEEGVALEKDCQLRIDNIMQLLTELAPFETERILKLRKKIDKNMQEYVGKDNIDANRFEQEILYYLEKMDITEEKVRLEQHCKYFLEELHKNNTLKGRKLIFISQEMGREINTLGSKANSSDIQRIVVKMKDDLEKIKEQVANAV